VLEHLGSPPFVPFSIAGGVMLGLLALEIAFAVLGKPLSALLDHTFESHAPTGTEVAAPDAHAPDAAGADHGPAHGKFAGALDWLNAGRVPGLILLILALAAFSVSGFVIQGVLADLVRPLPGWIASLAALIPTIPAIRASSRGVARVLPQDETYAASHGDLVGMTGMVILGPVKKGVVAKARFRDVHGNLHFPRIEPFDANEVIEQGAPVLAVEARGGSIAVKRASPTLTGRIA
jgi:hypothetical protein